MLVQAPCWTFFLGHRPPSSAWLTIGVEKRQRDDPENDGLKAENRTLTDKSRDEAPNPPAIGEGAGSEELKVSVDVDPKVWSTA